MSEILNDSEGIKRYLERHRVDANVIKESMSLVDRAFYTEKDIELGKQMGALAKQYIRQNILDMTSGLTFEQLEEMAQRRKDDSVAQIHCYYEVLRLEAPFILDSYKLFIEKDRPRKERFYEPRRNTLMRVTDAVQRLEDDKLDIVFLHQPPRTGKLLADSTPVFTSEGWKKHGDLIVGDKVIGSDGDFTEVIKIHEKNVANYKVTLSNGEEIFCHANHEWKVWHRTAQRWHVYETHEMLNKLTSPDVDKKGNRIGRRNLYLPLREPMKGTHKDLKLHPYVLGAWLGDGTNQKPWITDPIEDYAIVEKVIECGYPLENTYTHKTTGVKSFNFGRRLMDDLQIYDMCYYMHRCEKHIPKEYLTASLEQRLELLAGLLDTDGTLCRKEHRYHFSTVSKRLKNDVETLINTFGWRVCTVVEKPSKSSFGIEGKQDCYVISFNPTLEIPCVLERKHIREFSRPRRIAIDNIEPCKEISGNCITVSNADGLYAVGKTMQLTHNSGDMTMDTTWHCSRNPELSNLYVTYKEGLGGAFLDGVMEVLTDPTYCHKDVFSDVKIVETDAKNNKIDMAKSGGRKKKKYKTLSGKGLESGLNGEYDASGWLLIDDPLEGVQDVMSDEVLKRKQTIFDNNVLSRKKENCKVICIGTLWSTHDLFMNYLDFIESSPEMKDTRYEVIKIPALDPETDESNFDYEYGVGFSTKYYQSLRAKFENNDDMVGWNCQYQQTPIERDGTVFNPQHMNYYKTLPGGEPLKVISHVDIALGGADYLAMPVVYYFEDDEGNLIGYVEDVVFDNSEKHITEPQVVSMVKKHKIKHLHFEANQGGEGYADDIRKALSDDKSYKEICNITTDWALVTKRKQQRIWDNAEEIRKLYFKDPQHRDIQYRKFMNNLFSFSMNMRKRQHEDAADALSGLVDFERHGTGIRAARIISSPL